MAHITVGGETPALAAYRSGEGLAAELLQIVQEQERAEDARWKVLAAELWGVAQKPSLRGIARLQDIIQAQRHHIVVLSAEIEKQAESLRLLRGAPHAVQDSDKRAVVRQADRFRATDEEEVCAVAMTEQAKEWVQFRRKGLWHLDTGQHDHEWPYSTVFACGLRRAVRSACTCSGRPGDGYRLCKLCLLVTERRLREAIPKSQP